ncbi:hypothetical protein BDF19DRAFT_25808 [Syncephalis fuscata]|nr:hypothetical protein BDF19DRAFT_25808 [Syncephalis fuscata]
MIFGLLLLLILLLLPRLLAGNTAEQGGGFGHRPVPEEWVHTVHSMFPHLPPAAIRRELERTRSVELTCERILRDGTLPTLPSDTASMPSGPAGHGGERAREGSQSAASTSLLQRYQLSDAQLADVRDDQPLDRTWESESTQREKRLQARKAQMVLMARKRMLSHNQQEPQDSVSSDKGKERADY